MPSEQGMETSRTGVALATRKWPAQGDARAAVLIAHGVCEHSGRYEHVGEFLAGRGLEVHSFDHRGHGRSDGDRVHIESWDEYLDDLEDRVSVVKLIGLPTVLYGHSMGATISLDYALSSRPAPDLLILSGLAIGTLGKAWQRLLAPIAAKLAPRLAIPTQLKGEQLAKDPAVAEAYFADPLVSTKATARFGLEFMNAAARVERELGGLTIPSLVLHGADDTIAPPGASKPLAELPLVERIEYPTLRHEIHNEAEQEEVLSDIVTWLDKQL